MKFIFTCGGTAGHINPAISVAERIKECMPDAEILFIGSGRQLENRLIPMAGFNIENIRVSGFERSFKPRAIVENIGAVINLAVADVQMRKILKRFRPDAAIGTGGYVCYPVLKSCSKMGIPTLIHESNAIPGLTTKLLSGIVDKILVAFPGVENNYSHPGKVVMTGTPVRSGFQKQTKAEARKMLGVDDKPLVVSFWGSLGADRMNESMANMIARNSKERRFNHIHATGSDSEGVDTLRNMLRERGVDDGIIPCTDLRTYIDNMPTVMTACDLVLCRAGASTLGELQMMGAPAILVPSPYVANNHQQRNAEQLEAIGGARVINEKDCSGDKLYDEVCSLLDSPEKLREMSKALLDSSIQNSAQRIVDLMLSLCV